MVCGFVGIDSVRPYPSILKLTSSHQLGIHLCSQTFFSILCILVFVDFCDLEKMLIESTEGLEVTTVRENIWTKSLYHLQDCNGWLSSSCCWLIFVVLLNNKKRNMILTMILIKLPRQDTVTGGYSQHVMVGGRAEDLWPSQSHSQHIVLLLYDLAGWDGVGRRMATWSLLDLWHFRLPWR